MPMYGFLNAPSMGMLTQSSAFSTISQNITNLNTGGYKGTDTRFETVLASTFGNNSDVGGVAAVRHTKVAQQGNIVSTTNSNDVAINGQGMFVFNTDVDGAGETLYGRDGAFNLEKNGTSSLTGSFRADGSIDLSGSDFTFTADEAYLVDKNGHFLQGWQADETGAVNTRSSLVSLRVDRFAFVSDSSATTTSELAVALPADASTGQVESAVASIYDANGDLNSVDFQWTKTANAQEWTLTPVPTNGTLTSSAENFTFNGDGSLPDGTTHSFAVTWSDGDTSTVTLDLSDTVSTGTSFFYFDFQKNGRGPGDLESFSFDQEGFVNGRFTNGVTRPLYKLPLATFSNPDALEERLGNVFAESVQSGSATFRQADLDGFATYIPFAHELSNVNLGSEFTNMIMAQQAYNSAATVFKTADEMTKTAAGLKS